MIVKIGLKELKRRLCDIDGLLGKELVPGGGIRRTYFRLNPPRQLIKELLGNLEWSHEIVDDDDSQKTPHRPPIPSQGNPGTPQGRAEAKALPEVRQGIRDDRTKEDLQDLFPGQRQAAVNREEVLPEPGSQP